MAIKDNQDKVPLTDPAPKPNFNLVLFNLIEKRLYNAPDIGITARKASRQ
jgi:hypothetical protein